MAHDTEGWDRVGEAIAARIAELGLSKAEFIDRSGISDKTLNAYLAGAPIKRVDKRRTLCEALGWELRSIDAIRAGGGPAVAGPPTMIDRVARLEEDMREVLEILRRLDSAPDGHAGG